MPNIEWSTRLAETAQIYRDASLRGDGPTKAVEEAFSVSRSTAGAWIGRARAAGLLDGVEQQGRNQKAQAVADALGVPFDALKSAVLEHANGDLRIYK